ncbi:Hypothetical Protein SLY_1050 [Strawberry lethal yellows phytoplasma (CPA) str. NZSb11]|uniref:Uncharacterized protein n=1 Tax=Strawberry lethal yellows phytoplasma (CPA) str. NZSb11 TaxID=980422 RepID=R4S2C2_PHYAS|nr:Hypothetical Protein SLY_1050 [Strawberry lethal yellows phytoplasma (CPA) str. NZSb11]
MKVFGMMFIEFVEKCETHCNLKKETNEKIKSVLIFSASQLLLF